MKDFKYYAPTEVVFGRTAEEETAKMVKKYGGKKVLLHYGGKSAECSGLLPKVEGLLKAEGIEYVKLGGVVPNPRLSLVRKGMEICRAEGIDFLLAVGGGSVIDSAKAIGYGLCYDGDVWDLFLGKDTPKACFPLGCVLTIPAAGSEMSDGCVITNEEGWLKRSCDYDLARCKFAIMNPERTFTLPPYQTSCGVTDIMMHTMERYFSHDNDMLVTDNMAEAVLHQLEHELSGMFDVAHGAGLAALWPSWARYVYKENMKRFVQFAVNVMGVHNNFNDPEQTALKGIEAMEQFYHAIGMPVNIKELIGRDITDEEIKEMARKLSDNGKNVIGGFKKLAQADMENIFKRARG